METRTLVAYASKYGSTKEVAESITKILQENGLTVDLEHAKKVHSLEEYSAVVLGAPIYVTHLHKDAAGFLSKHHEALKKLLPCIIIVNRTGNRGKFQSLMFMKPC
ncbi:Flavodoxin [Methanosarcina mazei Tuc01]|uniref:Flavodoxin n=1 Tax=Methanosarcina mazei Tuc01 TaxID=1236903 RepID=M1QE38_METMZ|nr:flavodoxin domain-containing protein [Methanosarcina mazei]AGF98493.1 Flavodoxin [Methanosarcina mazei Tuc01]